MEMNFSNGGYYSYDADNRLSALYDVTATLSVFDNYDSAGRLTAPSSRRGRSLAFGYDAASRLTQITHLKTFFTTNQRFTYTYDKVGNRTTCVELTAASRRGPTTRRTG